MPGDTTAMTFDASALRVLLDALTAYAETVSRDDRQEMAQQTIRVRRAIKRLDARRPPATIQAERAQREQVAAAVRARRNRS